MNQTEEEMADRMADKVFLSMARTFDQTKRIELIMEYQNMLKGLLALAIERLAPTNYRAGNLALTHIDDVVQIFLKVYNKNLPTVNGNDLIITDEQELGVAQQKVYNLLIQKSMTQIEILNEVSCTPQRLSVILHRLEELNLIIKVDDKWVVV